MDMMAKGEEEKKTTTSGHRMYVEEKEREREKSTARTQKERNGKKRMKIFFLKIIRRQKQADGQTRERDTNFFSSQNAIERRGDARRRKKNT